jgi:hypothetical protein
MTIGEKDLLALSAYHDGELSRFGAWRLERRLRNSADLRHELAELKRVSQGVRAFGAESASFETPDSWPEIGPALSAIDREVEAARGKGLGRWSGANREASNSRNQQGVIWGSLGASGVLAALVLALVVDNPGAIPEDSNPGAFGGVAGGSLRYLQTNGVSYVVSQDSEDVTIIWLMDSADVTDAVEGA